MKNPQLARKKPKLAVGKKCPSHKNHQLSRIAAYLLNSADQTEIIGCLEVKSVLLSESIAPREIADWKSIFAQMINEHYLVPTDEENRFYVFTDKRDGTAFAEVKKRNQRKKSAA